MVFYIMRAPLNGVLYSGYATSCFPRSKPLRAARAGHRALLRHPVTDVAVLEPAPGGPPSTSVSATVPNIEKTGMLDHLALSSNVTAIIEKIDMTVTALILSMS